ncbi:MAG: hypothetical protein QOE86_2423 [Solirubrobacteraceae bacterium]|jgi:acetyltransferase-like isoleucine patch superfamily enzyme|nr:hypothetical protein [Solirubrobacteraceae bacterium]
MLSRLRRMRGEIREAGSVRVWALYLPGPGPWLMSWLRKKWVLWRNPHAHIEFQGPVYLGPRFSLHMPKGGTFIVAGGVDFRRGFRAELGPTARVTIGPACTFTHDVILSIDTRLDIGARCQIGQGCYVIDGNHRYRDLTVPFLDQGYDYRPIRIEDDAVILSKVTVVNSIGRRSIVGANSVVTKPVPPYCVVGGVPARVIDYFGPPGEAPIERSASSTATSG